MEGTWGGLFTVTMGSKVKVMVYGTGSGSGSLAWPTSPYLTCRVRYRRRALSLSLSLSLSLLLSCCSDDMASSWPFLTSLLPRHRGPLGQPFLQTGEFRIFALAVDPFSTLHPPPSTTPPLPLLLPGSSGLLALADSFALASGLRRVGRWGSKHWSL
jgi:hypothetical protein